MTDLITWAGIQVIVKMKTIESTSSSRIIPSVIHSINLSFSKGKSRLIIVPLIIVLLKIFGAFWIFQRLDLDNFLSLFHGWDSYFYVYLTSNWYPNQASELWAFFPLFPLFSYLINLLVHNFQLSVAIISLVAGIMWIPIYQLIAEEYMPVKEAFSSTCIFAFFPQIFLFTTVAYSESIFLFTSLSAWLFFIKEKYLRSCLLACFATLSRPYGILITLPLILGLLKRKLWIKITFASLPIFALLGWIWYSYIKTGDYLAIATSQEQWTGMPWQPTSWVQGFLMSQIGIESLSQTIGEREYGVYSFLVPLIAIIACLVMMSFEVDWRLGIYSIAVYTIIMIFGTPLSLMRFLPFIFPIWLRIRMKSFSITFAICTVLYIHGLLIWYMFSRNIWIG